MALSSHSPTPETRIDGVLHAASERARQKHGYAPVYLRTPLDEILEKEDGRAGTNDEAEERLECFRKLLRYFFADGPHPGVVLRRVYAIAKALDPALILWMSMEDIGKMFGETRAAMSWRIKQIFTNYISEAGRKTGSIGTENVRASCQKTGEHVEKLRNAALGNQNRKKRPPSKISKKKQTTKNQKTR